MIECDCNCFKCPFPNVPDECQDVVQILKELDGIDKDIPDTKTTKQESAAAKRKAYREENWDKLCAELEAYRP